jgi:hypothetical protein
MNEGADSSFPLKISGVSLEDKFVVLSKEKLFHVGLLE